jgi:hypothetical protein
MLHDETHIQHLPPNIGCESFNGGLKRYSTLLSRRFGGPDGVMHGLVVVMH